MSTSYIGLEPSYASFDKQLLTGDGSTVSFILDFSSTSWSNSCFFRWYHSRTRILL